MAPSRRYKMPLFEEVRFGAGRLSFGNWTYGGTWVDRDKAYATEYLYAFTCEGFVKIGKSADWRNRLKTIQGSCPFPVSKLAVVEVPRIGAQYGEYYAHTHMESFATSANGEWFRCGANCYGEVKALLGRARKRAEVYAEHYRPLAASPTAMRDSPQRSESMAASSSRGKHGGGCCAAAGEARTARRSAPLTARHASG